MNVLERARGTLVWMLGFAAMAGLNVLSVHVARPDSFSPWNPALGVGAGLLLVGGGWMALAVVGGQLAGAWWGGWQTPIGAGPAPLLVSMLAPLLLGVAVRRFLDADPRQWTVRQMLLLIGSTLAAGVAVTLVLLPFHVPGFASAPAYFRVSVGTGAGSVAGLSAVTLLVLAFRSRGLAGAPDAQQGRWPEFLGHMAFTLAVGGAAYVLHGPTGERFWSLYFIPLLWTAFRFEMPEVLAGLLLMGAEAILLADILKTPVSTLTNFHFFLFNFTATGLMLSAALRARREAERAKAEGDRRLRDEVAFRAQLLENVGEAIVGTDGAGLVLFWNAAAERMFGVSRERALGAPLGDIVRYELASTPNARPALLTGERWSGEVAVRRPDGAQLFALATTAPLESADGHSGFVAVWRDITAMRELERQFGQAQKMDAIGRLAGGVAHDFNNLLTVVQFNAREAAALAAGDLELTSLIEGINEVTDRASAMTRQLLAFTRAKQYHPKVFSVARVVTSLEKMLRRLLGERVELAVVCEGHASVRGDVGQLEQALVNLAVNARDAMPGGGVLLIHTDNMTLDPDEGRGRDLVAGEYVRIRVIDDGSGMDAATLSKAFEPFFTTKPVGEGTGLGLSTAYAMVRQAGGRIWADSAPGKGTTVTILLPRAAEGEEAVGDGAAEAAALVARAGTVLLVEDDERVAAVAQRVLTRAGYRVLRAQDGAAALQLLDGAGREIDLLITDVVMPRMNGPELVRQVRALRPDLPVVLMSGYTADALEPLAYPSAFLAKPFGPRDLLTTVQSFLGEA